MPGSTGNSYPGKGPEVPSSPAGHPVAQSRPLRQHERGPEHEQPKVKFPKDHGKHLSDTTHQFYITTYNNFDKSAHIIMREIIQYMSLTKPNLHVAIHPGSVLYLQSVPRQVPAV